MFNAKSLLDALVNAGSRAGAQGGQAGGLGGVLGNLAQRVSAPAEVHKDVEQWRRALDAWSDGLRAMPPTITDGRLIEPDTSGLDRALVEELCPLGARLRSWHTRQCAG